LLIANTLSLDTESILTEIEAITVEIGLTALDTPSIITGQPCGAVLNLTALRSLTATGLTDLSAPTVIIGLALRFHTAEALTDISCRAVAVGPTPLSFFATIILAESALTAVEVLGAFGGLTDPIDASVTLTFAVLTTRVQRVEARDEVSDPCSASKTIQEDVEYLRTEEGEGDLGEELIGVIVTRDLSAR